MSCASKLGKSAKFYYNSASYATPTWVEIARTVDLTHNLGKNTATTATRQSGIDTQAGGLRTQSITFGYRHLLGADPVFDFLQGSYVNDTCHEFAVMDGDITTTGTKGWRVHGFVSQMNENQNLEEAITHDCEIQSGEFDDSGTIRTSEPYVVS